MKLTKLTAILLAVAMCFVFAACQSDGGDRGELKGGELSESDRDTDQSDESSTGENETDMQIVGNEELGYVAVPGDWVKFLDLDGGTDLQYSNTAGTSIITLNVFDTEGMPEEEKNELDVDAVATYIWYNMAMDSVTDIAAARVTVNDYEAVQIYGRFNNPDHELPSIIVCWIVEDEQGVFHYVSAEGTIDNAMGVVSYVENSYSLENPDLSE